MQAKENLQFAKSLQALMDAKDLKAFSLAKAVGLSHVTIGNYLGGQPPKSEHLHKLAKFFGVSMETVLTGERHEVEKKPQSWGGPYWGTSNAAPVISFARGGGGAYPEDLGNDVPHIPVTCKDPNCYVLELEGDSMEPLYSPGDFLVCAPNLQPMPGDLVVARTMDDEVLFKKYQMRGKTVLLQSFNPKQPTLEFAPKEIRKMHLVQSVVRVLKGKPF